MTAWEWLRKVGQVLCDVLYPPLCVGCGQVGSAYCPACRLSAPLVNPPICPLCGRPQGTSTLCVQCASNPLHIDGIRSVALFEGTVREAIHRLKYDYVRDLAVPLGEMLSGFWLQASLVGDVIVPVPLHARRLKERGYNQAALLALRLSQATGIPVDDRALRRNRYTVSQTGLTAQQRRRNVEAAFSCRDPGMAGKRVVLIDDVCTTGATLEACSEAMREAQAKSVWALTVARAV